MKTFTVTHTEKANAKKETIWALWSDINNWPDWDVGLSACESLGDFSAGKTFKLTPKGAPEAVTATLQEVVENERFSDKTDLGFATIEAAHEMKMDGDDLLVTHTITANVADEKAGFFEEVIWPGFRAGLPQSVESLAKLAEQRECAPTLGL